MVVNEPVVAKVSQCYQIKLDGAYSYLRLAIAPELGKWGT